MKVIFSYVFFNTEIENNKKMLEHVFDFWDNKYVFLRWISTIQ